MTPVSDKTALALEHQRNARRRRRQPRAQAKRTQARPRSSSPARSQRPLKRAWLVAISLRRRAKARAALAARPPRRSRPREPVFTEPVATSALARIGLGTVGPLPPDRRRFLTDCGLPGGMHVRPLREAARAAGLPAALPPARHAGGG